MAGKEADIEKIIDDADIKVSELLTNQGINADPCPPPKEHMYQNWTIEEGKKASFTETAGWIPLVWKTHGTRNKPRQQRQ